jgi:hypothetical protein
MAKKVSKNQRTDRMKNTVQNKMAKVVVAEKKENGQYRFRQKMVVMDDVQAELKAAAVIRPGADRCSVSSSGRSVVRLARRLWEPKVAGSNPAAPTPSVSSARSSTG